MRFKLHRIVFWGVLLCWVQQLAGQNYIYNTYEITRTEGLLSNRVPVVYQDEDGFIWLRTLDGLGRYDGHAFKWFTKTNTAFRGVPRENLLVEDGEGYFWFTDGIHVDLMHRKTFEVIPLEDKFPEGVPFDLPIEQFWQGAHGGIFFKQLTTGNFYHYHPERGFKRLPYLDGSGSIVAKKEGIWVHSRGTLWRKFNLETGEVLKSVNMVNRGTWITGFRGEEDWFACLDFQRKVVILIKVEEGTTEEVMRIPAPNATFRERYYVLYNPVLDQLILNCSCSPDGVTLIDLENKRLISVMSASERGEKTYLATIFVDQRGVYWQQTPKGLRLVKISEPVFTQYALELGARGLWADSQHLVIQRNYLSFDNPSEVKPIPGMKRLLSVRGNRKGELFLGGGEGIFQIDPKDFSTLDLIPSPDDRPIWSILQDEQGSWWAGFFQKGLFFKTPKDTILRPYPHLNGFTELESSTILQLKEAGEHIWAVSTSGLYLLHKEKGLLHRYGNTAPAPYTLPFDNIHFLHIDAQGVFWVATNADGLVRFELDEDFAVTRVKRFTTDDNLSSNVLYAIIEDYRERLWISTLNGISCFDKKTAEIQLFTEEDGLAEMEFNRISYFQAPDGRIYFGTIHGVVAFYPDKVGDIEVYNSPLYLSELSIFDGESTKTKDLSANLPEEIILKPSDRFLRMNLSLVDYFHSDRLSYSYKIEGLFEDFQKIQGNVIELSGLPYGDYTLRVRGQSTDKRYSTQELTIPLIALRPIYFQGWFVLLMIAIAVSLATLMYFWRIQQLEQRRKALEILVEKRTAQIEEQTKQLRTLDEVKSRFFANISHELRTPLSLILAPLDQLIKGENLSNSALTYLKLIQRNAEKLLKRINELLDLSRLDANRLEVEEEPTALYGFLKTLLASFESAAQLKGIQLLFQFQLAESMQMLMDRDKVEKIISNFISNALKFTPSGGRITCLVKRDSDQLSISVQDTGIGIRSDELPKIFDRFYQSENSDLQEGTGIGLALCRELAGVLGGKVWAESETAGKTGSTFFLQLPIIETFTSKVRVPESAPMVEPEEERVATPTSIHESFRPSLLMVEDNPDLRQYVGMILGDAYQIDTAANGQEALEKLKEVSKPNLIISDIMMPVMDGMQLLDHIKQSPELRHIPVIMLTAQQGIDVKLEALRIGVDDYITKPFRAEELQARVTNLLANSARRTPAPATEEVSSSPATPPTPIQEADMEWLKELERIILDNLTSKGFKLADAASELHISYRRLQQKLKALTGLSPKQYQQTIRLSRAREILKSGNVQTVQEVMHQIGFDNHSYFSRLYTEAFGLKPIEELG